jgi:hypothetical protein
MPTALAQCPDCLAVRKVPIEHLGRNAECPCGAVFSLKEWTCGECNQILRDEAADRCPRCHTSITPRFTTDSPVTPLSNTEDLNDSEYNQDISATDSESVSKWVAEWQPGISNRSRDNSEGTDTKRTAPLNPRSRDDEVIDSTASEADSWQQSEEYAYVQEQELIAKKQQEELAATFETALDSERQRLQDRIDTLEATIARYERLLTIQGGSAFEIIKVVIFRSRARINESPDLSSVITHGRHPLPASQAMAYPMTIEQKVFFPVTRWIFLLAAVFVTVPLAVYIVSYISSGSSTSPAESVAVQLHDVQPEQSLSDGDGSDEPRKGPDNEAEPTLEQMYPDTMAKKLVTIFTSTGLYNERGVNAVLIRKLRFIHPHDTPAGYIENACEVLNRVRPADREQAFDTYHTVRGNRFVEALIRRESELKAAKEQQAEYVSLIGISALVLLQAVLVLCMLGIERNTRAH